MRYPYAKPRGNYKNKIEHLLWMIDQVPCLPNQKLVNQWVELIITKAYNLRIIDSNDDHFLETRALVRADLSEA